MSLTPRQTEVVQLAVNGMNARQIGRYLRISERTVEAHLARARRRISAASSAQLVARAVAAGIVSPAAISAGPGVRRGRGGTPAAEYVITFRNSGGISEHDQHAYDTRAENERRRKRGRPTVMTPDRINAAAEMLSLHPVTQIAGKLGVSRGTVHAHMRAIKAAQMTRRDR
jgi:DNA-binding CsgD family transcriptional regulator